MSAIEPYLVALRDGDPSALHLCAGEEPCWRVDAQLVPNGDPLPTGAAFEDLLQDLLDAGEMPPVSETGTLEEIEFTFNAVGARFRAEVFHSETGFSAVIRQLPEDIPPPNRLGLPETLRQVATERPGLVFICGPVRSGKTTTVASLLDSITYEQPAFLMTVGRTVEYEIRSTGTIVHQLRVGVDVASHADGLATAIRAGANVISLAGMPDGRTARLALMAADRGTLVLVTMEAQGPVDCIERFLDLLPDSERALHRSVLAQNLRMVAYQVLLPATRGGHVPAHELLTVSRAVYNHLRDGRTQELHAVLSGRSLGQRSLDESLEELIKAGAVEREEALRRARHRSTVEKKTAHV